MSVGRLLGAFLTTFDPPDPGVLIEEYLPVWLGLENSYAERGSIGCGTSPSSKMRYADSREDRDRFVRRGDRNLGRGVDLELIRRFEVGAEGAAVQHAKLWMFHRAPTKRPAGND